MGKSNKAKPTCWDIFCAVIAHSPRILLHGFPGTGKTFQATRVGLIGDRPIYSVTLTDETSAADLKGHWIPRGREFVWHHGVAIRAWLEGGRLVINELDHASPDVCAFLLVILDDLEIARLSLPTGATVRPHPDFRVVATMNGDPDLLPEALQDRFPVTIEIDATHPDALASLPPDLQKIAPATAVLPEGRRASLRKWQEFARLRERVDQKTAAFAVFGDRAWDVLDALKVAA